MVYIYGQFMNCPYKIENLKIKQPPLPVMIGIQVRLIFQKFVFILGTESYTISVLNLKLFTQIYGR
jgi:hypothetical protein